MSTWILVGTLWAKLFFWADGWNGTWGAPSAVGGGAGQVQTQDRQLRDAADRRLGGRSGSGSGRQLRDAADRGKALTT